MKDLRKDEHFQRLAETGRRVWTLLESCIQDRIQSRGLENLIPDFEVMLRRKRQGIFLRPYLSRLFLEVVGEEDWGSPKNLSLLAAVEAYNISTYHANTAIDGKFQADDNHSPSNQIMCAMQMLGVAHDLIRQGLDAPPQVAAGIHILMATNDTAYSALNIDLNILCYANLAAIESGGTSFNHRYLQRCKGICGSTFQLALLPLKGVGCDPDVYGALDCIASHLGLGIQAVNDLEDLAPGCVQDVGAHKDLKNGRLTLPYYLLHHRGYSREMLLDLAASTSSSGTSSTLSTLALQSGVVAEVKSFIRLQAWNPIRSQIRFLTRKKRTASVRYFQFVHHLLFGSRIWKAFEQSNKAEPNRNQ